PPPPQPRAHGGPALADRRGLPRLRISSRDGPLVSPDPRTLASSFMMARRGADSWLLASIIVCLWLLLWSVDARAVEPERSSSEGEARVAAVRVALTVWRGGDRPPDRDRIPRRRAEVDGVATYELAAPAIEGQRLVLLDYAEVLREQP